MKIDEKIDKHLNEGIVKKQIDKIIKYFVTDTIE